MIDLDDPNMGSPTTAPPARPRMDAAALPAGHRVFEYRIDRMLGGGGFGLTYLAHDINLELPVALKEYYPGDLATRSVDSSVHVRAAESASQFTWGLERFLDEARALASFRHPNIVRVLRYFRENGTAYIVMEYETGDPLKRWLARQSSLDQQGLLNIVHPLMDGLEAVHRMKFLHRDIKPDNIYIRADGSPVLLDFGAARRVTADRDMTNIVSPGFAPFEQYHSQGNQGPWTDVYSLGAVMYWMVTGHKPLESASRVKQDKMPRAVDAGHSFFCVPLLKAIDWAITPDEGKRPQSVAELRAALVGLEDSRTQTLTQPDPQRFREHAPTRTSAGDSASTAGNRSDVPAFAAGSQPAPQIQADSLRRNVLGTIMFMGLVSYSKYSTDQQVDSKSRFNELLGKALKGVAEPSRIVIDTGDGAAVCFLGDPEEALQSALLLRGLLMQKYGKALSVRMGLHLGPMRMVFDINKRVNVIGDGINVAQRIMDFARPNQIMASRAYYDVVSRITDTAAGLFSPMGPHIDKHMRSHDIYAVLDPQTAQATQMAAIADVTHSFGNTGSLTVPLNSLTPEMAGDIENELARLIGPLARVLVKKAVPRANSAQSLRDMLSISIPDTAAREAFVKVKSITSTNSLTRPNSMPQSGQSSRSRSDASQPMSRPVDVHSQPVSRFGDSQPASLPLQNLSLEQFAMLEKVLSQHIGPMARVIIRKESSRHVTLEALLPALSLHIDKPADRSRCLALMQKMLASR
ncbi:MAG: protein kinase [Pseudomonadota bacterium]